MLLRSWGLLVDYDTSKVLPKICGNDRLLSYSLPDVEIIKS